MEQKSDIARVARPKPVRPYLFHSPSYHPNSSPAICSPPREDAENDGTSFACSRKMAITYEQRQVSLANTCSLETLASVEGWEDNYLRDHAFTEKEMRFRSNSTSPFRLSTTEEAWCLQKRSSCPLAGNALLAPERPSNPMARDDLFVMKGVNEVKNLLEEEIASGDAMFGKNAPYNIL